MSTAIADDSRKVTTHRLFEMKQRGEKIAMLTAYDYSMAQIIDRAGMDVILVGDSASNVMAGNITTLPITLDQMIYHGKSVVKAVQRALVVVDLPFGSYQGNSKEALASAIPDPTVRGFVLQNLRRTDDGPGWAWLGDPRLLRAELDVVCGFPDMAGAHWDGPVLWVAGADSDYVQDRHEPVMRALFPRVRLVRVRGAGHWVHADRPQVFIGLLRAFLAPWSAGAGTRPTRPGGGLSPA